MDDTKNTNISISNDNENHLVNDNDSSKTKSDDDNEQEEIKKSTLNLAGLLGPTHPGRPANEEPHVKKTMKNKKEKIELICRVDQEELGFDEDEFEDLKALFLLFDYDQDGVVNKKEGQAMLRCLGLATDEERMAVMVSSVGVDTSHHSLSFNEFLSLVSRQRREEPSDQGLVTAFRLFDPADTGYVAVSMFRQILRTKHVSVSDITDMIEEYRQAHQEEIGNEDRIDYRKFIAMLKL